MKKKRKRESPLPCEVCTHKKGRRFDVFPEDYHAPITEHVLCRKHLIDFCIENQVLPSGGSRYTWSGFYHKNIPKERIAKALGR